MIYRVANFYLVTTKIFDFFFRFLVIVEANVAGLLLGCLYVTIFYKFAEESQKKMIPMVVGVGMSLFALQVVASLSTSKTDMALFVDGCVAALMSTMAGVFIHWGGATRQFAPAPLDDITESFHPHTPRFRPARGSPRGPPYQRCIFHPRRARLVQPDFEHSVDLVWNDAVRSLGHAARADWHASIGVCCDSDLQLPEQSAGVAAS